MEREVIEHLTDDEFERIREQLIDCIGYEELFKAIPEAFSREITEGIYLRLAEYVMSHGKRTLGKKAR